MPIIGKKDIKAIVLYAVSQDTMNTTAIGMYLLLCLNIKIKSQIKIQGSVEYEKRF